MAVTPTYHVRKLLREAVASAVGNLTTTGSSVFQSRVRPISVDSLPALLVFTTSEDAEAGTIGDVISRTIEVRLAGYAAESSDLDDVLDAIAKEIEIALASGVTVSNKTVSLLYLGCEAEFDDKGEVPTGSITLRYAAELYTTAGAPDVLL
jgi:hypothetical protein